MAATTPIARSKTAALARILDNVPRGYSLYTAGSVAAAKASALASKFHRLYGIGASPAQRRTRKSKGQANALLVMYWPEAAEQVEWVLLATVGSGLEQERLKEVTQARLTWLGYELVRHPQRGRASWTWRRPKQEMRDLYALLSDQLRRHHFGPVADTLTRVARQPGFHGVREQSWQLLQFALQNGYPGELPFLFYLQKVSHGDRLVLATAS